MRIIRRIIFQLLCLLGACCYIPATAQVVLVDNGKTKSRIILSENDQINQISANLFQLFLQRISGCTFPIVKGQNAKKGDIIISSKTPAGVTEDGFSLSTKDGILRISGSGNGTVYGVVTLLEQYLGVDYWGENEYSFNPAKTIELPLIDKIDNPAFRYRQTQCYAIRTDSIYKCLLPVIGCILLISCFLLPYMEKTIRNIILILKANAIPGKQANGV